MQSIHSISIGGMVEWLKASDCKSDDASLRRFESYSLHHYYKKYFLYAHSQKSCNYIMKNVIISLP